MWKEFKEFAVRGNVVDMAVGIIIGAAFTSVVQSLVKDVMMPVLGMVTSNIDFANVFFVLKEGTTPAPYATLQAAQEAGAVILKLGNFINATISFVFVAFAVFILVRYINKLKRPQDAPEPVVPKIKKCPHCFTDIAIEATRCPNCTSPLNNIEAE